MTYSLIKIDCNTLNYAYDNCLLFEGTTPANIETVFAKGAEILEEWFKEHSLDANFNHRSKLQILIYEDIFQ